MRKTPFAGLTQLDPSDPISTDGASFQSRNPAIEDRLLQVGAVTHRHDAHLALPSPDQTPSGTVAPSGGSIPAGTPLYLGYTLNDNDGGETIMAPVTVVSTPPPYATPSSQPQASADYTGGGLMSSTYMYAVTLIDGQGGETNLGPWVSAWRAPGFASGQVHLWGLTADFADNEAIGWRLYRAQSGQAWSFLASGSTDTFTDDGSICANCSIIPPPTGENLTLQTNTLTVVVPSGQPGGATQFNVYCSVDGLFDDPSLLGSYAMASAGQPIVFTSLAFLDGEPPVVSTCLPGANQINPDTDILQWTWKRPVPTQAMLPSGNVADVRVVEDQGIAYIASAGASAWTDWRPMTLTGVQASAAGFAGAGFVSHPSGIEFVGSGGTQVTVAQGPGGSAVVTILGGTGGGTGGSGATGATGPTGPTGPAGPAGASATITVGGSAASPLITGRNYLEFRASGEAQVAVADLGGGSAAVTIFAPVAAGGTGTNVAVAGSGATPLLTSRSYVEFDASGNVPVAVTDLGGGSARVLLGPVPGSGFVFQNPYASAGMYASATGTAPPAGGLTTVAFNDFSDRHNPPNGWVADAAAFNGDTGYLYLIPADQDGEIGETHWSGAGQIVTDQSRITGHIFRVSSALNYLGIEFKTAGGLMCARIDPPVNRFHLVRTNANGTADEVAGNAYSFTANDGSANVDYWIRITRNGNALTCELFRADPTPGGVTPVSTFTTTLTGTDATNCGTGKNGYIGAQIDDGTSSRVIWVRVESPGSGADTRHSDIHVFSNAPGSGAIDRLLLSDDGRSDFLPDVSIVSPQQALASAAAVRDPLAWRLQGSGAVSVTLASAVQAGTGVGSSPGSAAVATVSSTPEPWHTVGNAGEPAFANSWTHNAGNQYGRAQFRKTADGMHVEMRGSLTGGTNNATAFTLPAGYRPGKNQYLINHGYNGTGSTLTRTVVQSDGQVIPDLDVGPTVEAHIGPFLFSLDGSF